MILIVYNYIKNVYSFLIQLKPRSFSSHSLIREDIGFDLSVLSILMFIDRLEKKLRDFFLLFFHSLIQIRNSLKKQSFLSTAILTAHKDLFLF